MTLHVWRISDWPFRLKLSAGPALSLAALGLVAWFGVAGLTRESRAVTNVAGGQAATRLLAQAATDIQEINGRLYRVLSLQAANAKGLDAAAELRELKPRIEAAARTLTTYRDAYADEPGRRVVDGLIADVGKYQGAVDWVGEMLDVDFVSAVSFLAPFDAHYASLNKRLDALATTTAQMATDEAAAAVALSSHLQGLFTWVTALALLGVGALAAFVAEATVRSISHIAGATLALAEGVCDVNVEQLQRHDELGAIVRSLDVFRANQRHIATMQAMQQSLARQAGETRRADLMRLADQLESGVSGVIAAVNQAAGQMEDSARVLTASAADATTESSAVADAAGGATKQVEGVAHAANELTASIREISSQVGHSTRVTQAAVRESERSAERVHELQDAAEQIGSVVEMISAIAKQTNMLALNATIESARAGDAGRGFAVVAFEIKSLASQTARATSEIRSQIQAMQGATAKAATGINDTGRSIATINDIAERIAAAVEQQGAATADITRSVVEMSRSAGAVSGRIRNVADAANMTGSAAHQVLSASEALARQSGMLRDGLSHFLDHLRAG